MSISSTTNHQIDPEYLSRLNKQSQDRFIPSRDLLSRPPAAVMNEPRATYPRTVREIQIDELLAKAIFGIQKSPYEYPILRHSNPKSRLHGISIIGPNEHYPIKRAIRQPVELEDNFYNNPVALSNVSGKMAFTQNRFPFLNYPLVTGVQTSILDLKTKKIVHLLPPHILGPFDERPMCLGFSPKGNHLVLGKVNGIIELWALNQSKPILKWAIMPPRINDIPPIFYSVAFHGQTIYAGNRAGTLFEIDPKTGIISRNWQHHTSNLCSIIPSPNGKYLATGSNDNTVIIYETQNMKRIETLELNAAIKAIAFNPDGLQEIAIGGGSDDPRIRLFNFSNPEYLVMSEVEMGSQVTNLLWPQKNRLITTHKDGSFRLIPINSTGNINPGGVVPFSISNERILFADIIKQNGKEQLVIADKNSIIYIPKGPKQPKEAHSLLDKTIR